MCRVSVTLGLWCVVLAAWPVDCLNGDHVCMVQQKYNITKRVKYRAPMSVRTYEWCFSMPPRCSKWNTEMRELTKLETDERIAEVAVCCPGYKMKDVSCVPICPSGRTGHGCSEECPDNKWGPNCINDCGPCKGGICSPITGQCSCQDGWQGESCEIRMPTSTTTAEDLLTKSATKPTPPTTVSSRASVVTLGSTPTTLVEFTAQSGISKPIKPVSIPDTTSTRLPSLSTESPSIPDLTLPPLIKIPSTEKILTSTTNTVTVLETERTLPTKKPLAAVKPIRFPITTPMVTTIATEMVVTDTPTRVTEITIIETDNTTRELITSNPSVTSSKVISSPASTIAAFPEVKKTAIQSHRNIANTTTELSRSTQSDISTKKPQFKLMETTTSISLLKKTNLSEPSYVPKRMHELKVPVKVSQDKIEILRSTAAPRIINNVTEVQQTTIFTLTTEGSTKIETTKRPQSTIRFFPTTIKFKPKEIWIRPAQKGDQHKLRTETNQDVHSKPKPTQPNTTPKTIIVSIIPTSVSYATFKKIALSTTSLISQKTNKTSSTSNITSEREVTQPMSASTTTEATRSTLVNPRVTQKILSSKMNKTNKSYASNSDLDKTTKAILHTTKELLAKTVSKNETNSMTTMKNLFSNSLTTSSTNAAQTRVIAQESTTKYLTKTERVTRPVKIVTVKPRNVTIITVSGKNKNETVKITKTITKDVEKTNATYTNQVTTERDEEFHILTEPEHITAVMEGKGKERSSVDLISVISIAGGVMMAVITVAVVIVMMERWRRPRYEDGRKISDIRMQVMIDNDVPPPYVRSIFHTPLPDPPSSEKCHYQPISTLDRNLKQFMRPVVVQTISPIMLENFRGILECHYDHLPRRSHTLDPRHCSVAPSLEDSDELTRLRPCCDMDSTIEAMKCEATLDEIDNTTSEPLYAEIPCWRPPSEHAVEIMNLNGEAVTEL